MNKKLIKYALLMAALLTSTTVMAETTYQGYDFTNLTNNATTTSSTDSKGKVNGTDMNLLQIGESTFGNRFAVSRAGETTVGKGWTAKNYSGGSEYGLYTQYKDRYFTILDLEAGDQIKVFWETKGDGALNFYDADAVAGISAQDAVSSGKTYTIKTTGNVNLYTTESTIDNAKVYIQSVFIIKGATASAESVTYDFAPLATTSNGFTAATYWNANAIKIDGTNGYFILKGTGETAIAPRFAYGTKNNDWSLRNNSSTQYCGLYTKYEGKTLAIMDLEEGDKVTINVNEDNRLQFSGTPIVKDKSADNYVVKNTKYTVTAGGNLYLKTASGNNNTHINSIIIEPEAMTAPGISLKSGDASKVVITNGASDYDNTAKTYYTTDGTDPTSESAEYTGELSPESNCTIKAITISKTGKKSAIAEYQFVNPNSYTYTTDVYNFKGYGDGSTAVDPTWGSAVDGKDLNMLAIGDVTFGNKIAIGPQSRNAANNTGFLFRDSSPYYGLYSQYDGRTISVLGLNPGDKVTINIAKKDADTDNLKIVGETENIVSGQAYVVGSAGSMDFTSTGSVYIESIKIETQNDGTGDVAAEELTGLNVVAAQEVQNAVTITAATSSRGYATVTYYTTDGSNPVLNTNANRVKLESDGNITYGADCTVVNVATISTVTGNISSTSLNVTYTAPAPATPTVTLSETENTVTISTVENTFYSTDYDGTTTLTVSEGAPTGDGTWTAVPDGGIITLTAADNGKTVYAVTISDSNVSTTGSASFTWKETVSKPTIIQTGNKVTITAGTIAPDYDGTKKVRYAFNENALSSDVDSPAEITIADGATTVKAVTVGQVATNTSEEESLTLLAQPTIADYTEGDAKNTIQITNANFYSTDYDGTTALTISEGKPSGNGTWNAVTDGGIINTLTASSTVYAVKVDGNNISPVSAVYNFEFDSSVLPIAAAPEITASENKVTITTKEEGATTKYYIGSETEGTTISGTSTIIENLTATTTIKAVSAIDGKQDATTNFTYTYIQSGATFAKKDGDVNIVVITAGASDGEKNTATTTYSIPASETMEAKSGDVDNTNGAEVALTESCTITAVTTANGNTVTKTYEFTYTAPVAAPTITTGDGTNKVKITAAEGATIYYAIGDNDITIDESHKYTEEFEQTTSATIKAIAVKEDAPNSAEATYRHIAINTLPTIVQTAESNEVVITIGATDATLEEGETITTTYQIGDAEAVTITEGKTLNDLTEADDNKVITVTTTVKKGDAETNTASATLTFAYVAPVSDGKIDVTYDFTGFDDKTNFTQANPLATADNDFDNRFAVSRITGDAGFWLRSFSDKTKGLYSKYEGRTLTVKKLKAGDKVTFNWHCDDSQNTDNDGKFVLADESTVVSGSPIVIAEDGDLTIKSAKGGTKDPYVTITSIILHEAETLSAPTIAVNPENNNEVIITAGKTNNANATVTTYYAITTDGTDPEPTTESTTKFTGSGAKETITLTQSIKIKAITVSSTEGMAEQPSEVTEFTYVAETLTAPTIKLALADNSVVITAGKSNNEEATVTTYYSLNGEAPTISETNEQKFTGESKELTLEADATIIAVSVSSTGKVDNATSEAFTFTYDAPDGKTRFNTTYDFTGKDGNPFNQDADHKVTSNGTSLYLLAYDENTNFDNRFAIGPDSRTGNNGFYFRNNNATYKGLFTGYDNRNFSVLNLKKGDKVTLTLSNNAETLKFVEGDVVISGKAYTAKEDGNMDFVTLTGGVYIEKVVIAEAEAVQAPTLTLSEDGTKVTIAAGVSNNPEATVSTYYTTTGSISFNDGKAVTEGLTLLTADNSVITVSGTTNIEAIAISNGGAESIVTKGSYVESVAEGDSKTYDFVGYGDETGVIPAYATEVTSGGQTLYLLAIGEETFDNRFAVGPKREDANVFKFREDGSYKGLYSQYDKRYFSILNLKKGEKVTLTINGNAETLQFGDATKVLEMTGGTNAAKVAEGAKVKSGTTYYINEDGNLDFVTTGSIYIESAKISAAVEDEELTIAETVSKPTITDNGDNTVTITAGVSDAGMAVTTYYTTDGTEPTAESTEYKEALALTADCTVKAVSISEQGTKSEVAELAFTYVAPVEGEENYDFVVAAEGQTAAPTFGDTVEGTDLQMLAYGTKTFGNRFAVGPTSRNDGTNGGFTFRTSGNYKGLWSQYADRNFSILSLKKGDKVTITISKEAATLKFSDTTKALEITSATDNTASKLAEGATAKSGTAYYITADGNLDFVTTGGVYIESVKIEEAAEGDTAPTIAETVSKPTITDNGDNTVTITAGVSDAGMAVTTYYTTDGTEPTAESTEYKEALALTADCTVKAVSISEQGTRSEVAELAFTIKEPTHQDGYGLFDFTLWGKDDKGADAIVKPDYGTDGLLAIGKEDFDNRFVSGPSNRIEDNTCFRFRNSGNYKGLWSQYSDRTLAVKDLAVSDTVIITMNASAAALKFTGTPIVANAESGDNVESGKVYIVTTAGQLDLITSGETYIENIVIKKGDGTLPEMVSAPKMQLRQGKYNTVIIVPGKSSDSSAQVTTYYTTDGSEPSATNGTAINGVTDVTFDATTTAVKAVTISSTGTVGDVATYDVSYEKPVENGEPHAFGSFGSAGGVVPEWGSTVTARGETLQLIAIGNENFGDRFAAGPTNQNAGANCFKFREAGSYKGLFSQYADRYFAVLNLRVGDQVIVNISKRDGDEINLYSTETDKAVESGEPITVTSPGSMLFRSTGSVYIESVLILNTGSGTSEEQDPDQPDTSQEPEQPNIPVVNEDGSVTTAFSFSSFGNADGVVPEWGEDVQVGDVTMQMLSIGDEDFGNKIACGPKRDDDRVFKFRNSNGYQGLYSQYADRYLSILDLKNGDQVTIVMNANANNLAFNGDPQVEAEQPSEARNRAGAANTEPSSGDQVESGVTYTVKTSQASTSLDFVTTGSVYITQIIVREVAGTTRILDLENQGEDGVERIYDMSGRRVQQMVKGRLYIVNGKKVLYK